MSPEEQTEELRSLVISTRALIETSRAGVLGAGTAVIMTAFIQLGKHQGLSKAGFLEVVEACWGAAEGGE